MKYRSKRCSTSSRSCGLRNHACEVCEEAPNDCANTSSSVRERIGDSRESSDPFSEGKFAVLGVICWTNSDSSVCGLKLCGNRTLVCNDAAMSSWFPSLRMLCNRLMASDSGKALSDATITSRASFCCCKDWMSRLRAPFLLWSLSWS